MPIATLRLDVKLDVSPAYLTPCISNTLLVGLFLHSPYTFNCRTVLPLFLHCRHTTLTLFFHCPYNTLFLHCCHTVLTLVSFYTILTPILQYSVTFLTLLSHYIHTVVPLLLHCSCTVRTLLSTSRVFSSVCMRQICASACALLH